METIKRGRLANLIRGRLRSRHRLWQAVTAESSKPQGEHGSSSSDSLPFAIRPRSKKQESEHTRPSSELLPFADPYDPVDETFSDFNAGAIDMFYDNNGELARFSWRKTRSSKKRKVRTSLPPTAMFASDDSLEDDSALVQVSSITPRQWELEYKFVRNLAPGNQGIIDIYQGAKCGTLFAVKKIEVEVRDTVPEEVQLMKDLLKPHPNIIEQLGIFYDAEGPTCNIIMEYCSGGDLHDFADHWLYDRAQNIPEMFLLHFIASMGEALGHLHLGRRHCPAEDGVSMPTVIQESNHQPLLHRDIKLDNIFLRWSRTSYGMPEIVLGDFGGATLASQPAGLFGTPGYFPPEVRTYIDSPGLPFGDVMSTASDVYTVGACLCYLLVWGSYAPDRDIAPIFNSSSLRGWPLLLELLEDCLEEDPEDRPPTVTLFDWAPILGNRIRFLYEHGVRMPEGSWPAPKVVADTASVDAVHRRSLIIPESIYTATTPSADAWEFDDGELTRSISTLTSRRHPPAVEPVRHQPAVEPLEIRPAPQRVWNWTFRGPGEPEMTRSLSSANPTDSWLEAQRACVDQLPRSPSTPTTRNHWPESQPGSSLPIEATQEPGSKHPSCSARVDDIWLPGAGVKQTLHSPEIQPEDQPSKECPLKECPLCLLKNSNDDQRVSQRARKVTFRVLPARPRRVSIRRPPSASTLFDVVGRMANALTRLSPKRSQRAVLVSRFSADSDFE